MTKVAARVAQALFVDKPVAAASYETKASWNEAVEACGGLLYELETGELGIHSGRAPLNPVHFTGFLKEFDQACGGLF